MLGRLSIIIQVLWSKQNPLFPINIKNINFIVLLAIKQKKPSLNKNQIDNLANHYSNTFSLWEINVHWDTAEIWKWTFRLYQLVCHKKCWIKTKEIKKNRFLCKIPSKKKWTLLEGLQKSLFIKVTTRRKIRELLNSIYHDEIMFKVVVFK